MKVLIKLIINVFQNKVFKNSIYLTILQLISVLGPLLVIPYLAKSLGPDNFGELMMGLSWIAIGLVLTDYGFNLSAVKTLSEKINNNQFVCEYVSTVYVIKFIIMFSITILAIILNNYFEWFSESNFNFMLMVMISQSFFLNWFFYARETMKYVTIFMGIGKLLYVFLVTHLVVGPDSLSYVYISLSIANVVTLILSIIYYYKIGYHLGRVPIRSIKEVAIDSFQFFLSRFMVALYTSASTFLVGAFGGALQAGYYGIGEKFLRGIQTITNSFAQALFPHMVKNNNSKLLIKGTMYLVLAISIPIIGVMVSFQDIVLYLFGSQYIDSIDTIMIFLIISIVNSVSVCFGYPAFSSIGFVKYANYSVMFGGAIQVFLILMLSYFSIVTAVNVAFCVLFVELFVMVYRLSFYYILKKKSL